MPSAPQKPLSANGRSADAHTTTVLSRPAASSLKRRTDAWQTPVPMLGKMLSTTREPAWASEVKSVTSAPVRVYAGAWLPGAGSSPAVWTGLSPSKVVAMATVYQAWPGAEQGGPDSPGHHPPPSIDAVLTRSARLAALAGALALVPTLAA